MLLSLHVLLMFPKVSRNLVIVVSVLLFHGVALWALQTGLLRRVVEVLVPVELLSEIIEPPQPKVAPAPPPAQPPKSEAQPVIAKATTLPPPPMPLAIAEQTPAPNAPTGVQAQATPLPPITAPVAATPAPAAPKVELPSSDADYLQNPKPAYPAMSKRLGEQGKVVLRVLIGIDGTAKKAEIGQSSGFDRLDQSALATVLRWRYVPGKRAGVPEAMWFNVPINFVLE